MFTPPGGRTAFRRGDSEWYRLWYGKPRLALPPGSYESLRWLAPGGFGSDGRSHRVEVQGEAREDRVFEFQGDW